MILALLVAATTACCRVGMDVLATKNAQLAVVRPGTNDAKISENLSETKNEKQN